MKRRHVHGVQEKGKSTNPEPTFQCLLGLRGKKNLQTTGEQLVSCLLLPGPSPSAAEQIDSTYSGTGQGTEILSPSFSLSFYLK